jgi:hypothetical protein
MMQFPPPVPSVDDLRVAVEWACQPSYMPKILQGRARVLSSPKAWILSHIERVADDTIDWDDDWEYLRLLELFALLDPRLLPRATEKGLTSQNLDVREAAEYFRNPDYVELTRRNFIRGLTEAFPEFGAYDWSESDQKDGNPS